MLGSRGRPGMFENRIIPVEVHGLKMMSIGLHCRLVGRPGRFAALARFLDYIAGHDRVWVPTRLQIAEHWHREHRALSRDAHVIG